MLDWEPLVTRLVTAAAAACWAYITTAGLPGGLSGLSRLADRKRGVTSGTEVSP
jgi:hypothetical protein